MGKHLLYALPSNKKRQKFHKFSNTCELGCHGNKIVHLNQGT